MSKFDELSTTDISNLIDEYIHNERNRAILKRRLLDGALYKEIAEEFHLDYDYTRKLIHKCEDKLFKHIRKTR